jgi:hypothetical protein
MEQNPSSEANSFSAGEEIPGFFLGGGGEAEGLLPSLERTAVLLLPPRFGDLSHVL